ncbi:MAG: OmpA family protein [Oryzomonas sp.]|uniref:OmpA family protein n=1 Tax=Oryzomonas sp. TaxID=2855186 RepID=UPI00283C1203|nr:OmpA family protein [Oryzomonas sp.]MDR3580934.1 OmpA family protein [Oryzomonas sp.]
MNKYVTVILVTFLFFLVVSGCASRNIVVLIPDPNGHVGKAEVITDGGKQLLEKSYGMTTVTSRSSVPSSVTIVSPEYIAATFADVLAIEPSPAEKFILYFNSSTVDLVPESRSVFTAMVASIKRRGAIAISISGHSDATGSTELNDKLSYNRAHTISKMLMQQGVSSDIMTVTSHGKGNQLIPTADGVSEPRNRRVEVIVR